MKKFVLLLIKRIDDDQALTGAAALAFYFSLATFPALISLIALLAYFPIENINEGLNSIISSNLPKEASDLLLKIATEVVSVKMPALLSTGFLIACWSASSGVMGIIQQLNKVLEVNEKRNYFYLRLISLLMLFFFSIIVIISISLLMYIDTLSMQYEWVPQIIISYLMVQTLFAGIYYLAPDPNERFRFITPGSVTCSIFFLVFINGFKLYLLFFNNYNKTYGSLGGMIIFMLWLYVISFLIILGAQINKTLAILKYESEAQV